MQTADGPISTDEAARSHRPGEFGDRCAIALCRSCGGVGLRPVIDFGLMPISNGFVSKSEEAVFWPLGLVFCTGCSLAQLLDVPPADLIFDDRYPYLSGISSTIVDAARVNAHALAARYDLNEHSRVVEIACNDGYLLRQFAALGIPVLGVEPSPIPAALARGAGIDVIEDFFNRETAVRMVESGHAADLVVANNVLAHVPDPNELAAGIAMLAGDRGRAVIEVHAAAALLGGSAFDTIYHEHSCYYSATSIAALFRRHGLKLIDLERIALQGGSLRLHFAAHGEPSDQVADTLAEEAATGIANGSAFDGFGRKVEVILDRLRELVGALVAEGQSIAAYGAAAKGTMLLNHLGFDRRTITRVADRNPHKQGLLVPGVGIPIVAVEQLFADRPDAILVLPWNLRDEIFADLAPLREQGTRLIVPLPEPEVIA